MTKPTPHEFYLAGYDKDNDLYETITSGDDIDSLQAKAEELVVNQARCKETNEPFDWFEILQTRDNKRIAIIV